MHYFIPFLFLLTGTTSLLAAVMNWDWFFNSKNAQMLISNMNRKNARLLYGVLGIVLIVMAVFSFITAKE